MTEFIISFFTAALSGMGVGGGGLFLIYLTLVCGTAQREAQLANLVFFIIASSASLTVHIPKRRIPFFAVFILSLGGAAGAVFGSRLSVNTDEGILRMILGAFLFFSGVFSLFGSFGTEKGGGK